MSYTFFHVPARHPDAAAAELNAFLDAHRVLRVDSRFVDNGEASYWAFAVEWIAGAPAAGKIGRGASNKAERVDYREVLSEADFALYARLRNLRKTLAEAAGVPPYAVFTNEQLAAIVTTRAQSMAALASIEGVGPARVEKYGAAVLQELNAARAGQA